MSRWDEADSDPLADILAWREAIQAASGHSTPNRIYMSRRNWYRILRGTKTKRQWRRYRGKHL